MQQNGGNFKPEKPPIGSSNLYSLQRNYVQKLRQY